MDVYLDVSGLCQYLKISKSTAHKLSSRRVLPTYKPSGKLIYFKRSEVDAYLEKHRNPSMDEIKMDLLQKLSSK